MASKTLNRILSVMLALLLAGAAHALSPPPPLPIDELVEFYQAMDGDNWHRNDGWLDPEVDVCDWYGITCVTEAIHVGGFQWVGHLRLTDNNLNGELTSELVELLMNSRSTPVPSRGLDLSGNHLTGELTTLPLAIRWVELADNAFTGPLPEVPNGEDHALQRLDLSRNALTGPVPASWTSLQLRRLQISGNRLTGGIEPVLAALSLDERVHLDVAGNQFSGPLPDEILALNPYSLEHRLSAPTPHWGAAFPPGLNLCWNDFEPPDGELAAFVDQHHHGGRFAGCQRPRRTIGPEFSGSWFDPERNGEGFVQHLLDTGQVLLYWFTYPYREDPYREEWTEADQAWYLGLVSPEEISVGFENMHQYWGQFGSGSDSQQASPFRLSISPLQSQGQHIAYSRSVIVERSVVGSVTYGLKSLRHDQVALTRLAGSTCDNQHPHQWISGAWYDPERDGEGFMVEVNHDGRGAVYWFTHTPDGPRLQAWMMGDGNFDGTTLTIDSLVRPVGTRFGEDFEPEEIEFTHWGSLTMTFDDDLNGHIWFDSVLEEYGSGDYPIERLARPMLAECSEG